MIAIMVKYDGDWQIYDVVGNIEHAMAIADEVRATGHEVAFSDGPYGDDMGGET